MILTNELNFRDGNRHFGHLNKQGRSQTRYFGWAREEYFLIFPHPAFIFSHFSSVFPLFLPQFVSPGGRLGPPGKVLATPLWISVKPFKWTEKFTPIYAIFWVLMKTTKFHFKSIVISSNIRFSFDNVSR